jgi:hypothetical protein
MKRALSMVAVCSLLLVTARQAAADLMVSAANQTVPETTKGNISILWTVKNTGPSDVYRINSTADFSVDPPVFVGGELDDAVLTHTLGQLPVGLPAELRPDDLLHFRTNYTVGDVIQDGDIDKGMWDLGVRVRAFNLHDREFINFLAPVIITVTDTPEPASLTLLGIGAAGALGYSWRRTSAARLVP